MLYNPSTISCFQFLRSFSSKCDMFWANVNDMMNMKRVKAMEHTMNMVYHVQPNEQLMWHKNKEYICEKVEIPTKL